MIKIKKGIYGYRKDGRILPINSKSEPIELDAKEEKRLVDAGVAESVGSESREKPETKPQETPQQKTQSKNLDRMKLDELRAMAKSKGLNIDSQKKQDYIDAINNADNESKPGEITSLDAASLVG